MRQVQFHGPGEPSSVQPHPFKSSALRMIDYGRVQASTSMAIRSDPGRSSALSAREREFMPSSVLPRGCPACSRGVVAW